MRNFYSLLLFIFIASSHSLYAGDTTSIRTHDKVVIKTDPSKGFTEYAQKTKFPDASVQYRKAYLYLEFGCAPGLKCGEWDYGNHIYLKKDSVRYEIARFITPYGFYWNSSQNWKHGWYFDLTDFSYLLHDSLEIIYKHSGYESNTDRGWTVTMDYNLVLGEPARIPLGIETLYQLSAPFGNDNNPFDSTVRMQTFTMPANSDMVNFKTIQTGHGMDQQENCAEFCKKNRFIYLDNQLISEKAVWRDNCGFNSLFPQAGTWIYDRAGWCPGASVVPDDVHINLNPNTNHQYKINMQNYSNTVGGSANYMLTSHAMFFKDNRKQNDASIEDIIAPSSHYEYLRLNPTCGSPIIRVKNLGRDTITKVEFEYGKVGGKMHKIWAPCYIKPFETGDVALEAVYDWTGPGNDFYATLTKINDLDDENTVDNTMYSKITNTQTFPDRIYIVFKTNNAPSENSYVLKDAKGNVIASKNNFAANTIYRDTVDLKNNICYTFEFSDEGIPPSNNPLNKDGLDWWGNPNDGAGYIQIRSGKNNAMLKNFTADFGTKHILNFYTTYNMSTDDIQTSELDIQIAPNPSNGNTNIHINQVNQVDYKIVLYDMTGRIIHEFENSDLNHIEHLSNLSPGLYTLTLVQNETIISKKFVVQ